MSVRVERLVRLVHLVGFLDDLPPGLGGFGGAAGCSSVCPRSALRDSIVARAGRLGLVHGDLLCLREAAARAGVARRPDLADHVQDGVASQSSAIDRASRTWPLDARYPDRPGCATSTSPCRPDREQGLPVRPGDHEDGPVHLLRDDQDEAARRTSRGRRAPPARRFARLRVARRALTDAPRCRARAQVGLGFLRCAPRRGRSKPRARHPRSTGPSARCSKR